ncbi:uncharacterized protein UTRI_02965 [Ustilago trichophora]|uniref:Uncharacterized protein n=1 Tax=Ustilago trichophora TaxID=86804 RepID=A0A5C3EPD9_9BASI|nr:uncharacterized protein UTRI_02965 [Ustilago trichophora]
MSALASGSRRTRASLALPTPSILASATRTRDGTASRRRTITTLSRSRPDLSATDSSDLDLDNHITANIRRSFQPPETDDAISQDDIDQEALDEQLVLDQVTPRPNRRVLLEPVNLDTTQTALDRFRLRQRQGESIGRASIAGPPPANTAVSRSSERSQVTRRSRQSAPLTHASNTQRSGSRSMHTARSEMSAAPSASRRIRLSRPSAVDLDESSADDETVANTTMARPGQRLRPSLAHPDGRLDVPTIEERCAALVINAKGVLHFYMELYTRGWRSESFNDMLRNWIPFESYKTNQLLAEAQYMHHFIDIQEVNRSLRASGQPRPEGFDEAMKMANCATFVHYIHQLPSDPAQYGRYDGHSITSQDVVRAPLRNISELSDARRIFLRWILPFQWDLSDEVLNMLLDMSIQIYIHRLERIVEAVRAGEMADDVARTAISDHLIDLMSGDVVRHSLQRVKKQRRMSRAEIERMVQRYETFANVRQIDLQNMQYDYQAMRQSFSFQSMSADLTGYVRDVVREVDAGMQSSTLPLIIDRLARESSVFSASDVPDPIPASSSVIDGGDNDSSSVIAGPSQSTPKALARAAQPSQPFASQYADWLDDILDDQDTQRTSQRSRPTASSQAGNIDMLLTDTQKVGELEAMLMEPTTDDGEAVSRSSVDMDIASSPPRTAKLGARLSAALHSSRRATVRDQASLSEAIEASETSDATGILESHRNRDGPFDSPAKEKAGRLGFDSQNRLVRRTSPDQRKNQRLLDGSTAAVQESRFDSQGEEEEDVFLDNAVQGGKGRKRKAKAKAKAAAPARPDTVDEAEATPRPKRNLRSNAAQRPANRAEETATDEDQGSGDVNERQTARRKGSRSAARQLQLKQESLSPTKARAESRIEAQEVPATRRSSRLQVRIDGNPETEAEASTTRASRSRAAQDRKGDGGTIGLGRGLPNADVQTRILRTVSGRLHEEGEGADDDREDEAAEQARSRAERVNEELGATRATPDELFIGDDDEAILDRRAALDAAIAAKRHRPGTLHFYRPEADDEAIPLAGLDDGPPAEEENVDAIAMRDAEAVADILRSSNTVPSRRIGPYRPGSSRNRPLREERVPTVEEEEVDELEEEFSQSQSTRRRRRNNTTTRNEPLGQTVHVQPYKRSNLYITGHNMTGRSRWTDAETDCLLESLHELARYKKVAPKFKVYTEILKRHGVRGTQSRTLARWNNVQLKDKSRNELIRMKREGFRIPYWKRLLHPNIWKPPPPTVERRRRDETEDVPEVGEGEEVPVESEAGEDAEDPIRNDDDEQEKQAGQGEVINSDGVEVVIDGMEPVEDGAGERSSNPLRNDP